MKKFTLASIGVLINILAFSQTLKVMDKTSLQPLLNAAIYSNNPKVSITTNSKGEADISTFKVADSIFIKYIGYQQEVFGYSQLESMQFKVGMTEQVYSIGEIVVSASRFEEKKEDVAQQIQVMNNKELQFMNQQTTADVIQQSGNVLVQKSQLGGGSPIIRGFETNKVLMVVDGVRMNNAIYRGGHLQNIITLDNAVMDKVEIVFGPGSVVYGSDALGGVMHFYTKNPMLSDIDSKSNIKANAFTRYSTAYEEKTAHVDFNIGLKKVGFLTSFTYSDLGDLRQGNNRNPFYGDWGKRPWYVERINGIDSIITNPDPNIQKLSGYKQYDILEKILYKQNEKVSHILNFQYSTSSDITFYSRLTQLSGSNPKYAEWYYGPQKRLFGSYTLNLNNDKGFYDHARIIAGYQNLEESRHDRKFRKDIRNNRIEKLGIMTFNADFEKKINKNEIRYGLEATYNKVNSTAFQEDIVADTTAPLDTRYPDGGSTVSSVALYFTHTYEITSKLILNDGLRYSYVTLNSLFNDTTFFPFPFNKVTQKNSALTGNIGLVFMPGKEWRFALLGSSGFRTPNVDDLSKVFESVPGSVVVPNPDLKPEYTYNGELTISKGFNKKVRVEGTGFYTIYKNAITTNPSQFNGQDSINYDGQLSQVISNQNALEAYIYGFYGGLQADITNNFSINSSINYTFGRIKTDSTDYPLDHIPPVFGKTSFILKVKKLRGEFFVFYNGWKALKDYNMLGEDNFSQATANGMPSWATLNVRASYSFTKNIQLQMALENITDANYRVFASGISSAGRNFVITLRGNF